MLRSLWTWHRWMSAASPKTARVGLVQGLRAVENHQQAAVRAQPAALEIREQALTHGRVLGRAFPQPERVFLAVGRDPERHHEAVLADVHAVEDQRDEVEAVERGGLPRPQLRRRLGHEAPADAALARPATHHPGRHRLQAPRILAGRDAHQHLVDDAPIQRVRAAPAPETSAAGPRARRRARAAVAPPPCGRPAPPRWAPCRRETRHASG